jgi:pimeloyl-ACP methyl ester carboxylesterase
LEQFVIAPTDAGYLVVDGCPIAYAAWSTGAAGPIVLVHGAGAHMGWWDGVIQQLVPSYRVVALDLSGHGDSGWREHYTGEQWAKEVLAIAHLFGDRQALLVGHSLGGRVSIVAGALEPDVVPGLILVDAPVRRPQEHPESRSPPRAADRRHESLDHAIESFHLRPSAGVPQLVCRDRCRISCVDGPFGAANGCSTCIYVWRCRNSGGCSTPSAWRMLRWLVVSSVRWRLVPAGPVNSPR